MGRMSFENGKSAESQREGGWVGGDQPKNLYVHRQYGGEGHR